MARGNRSNGIFLSGPMGPEFNPHQHPHANPDNHPHDHPHNSPHAGPLTGYGMVRARQFGPRLNPDPIGGEEGAVVMGEQGPGGTVSQRSSLSYDPWTASPWPWEGVNPDWTYSSDDALLSQALRKVQARLVGERDIRRSTAKMGKVLPPAATADALWRWQSEFRQQAVVAELLGHSAVQGSTVYLLRWAGAGANLTVRPQPLVEIKPPNAGFNYDKQIDKVLRAASEREERLPEILSQAADFRPFFYSLTGLDLAPIPHIDELIDVAWAWATHIVMLLKNNIAEYRPVQRSALVVPIIATPGHGSLPSGHATIAAMTAHLLSTLLGYAGNPREQLLHHLASRIAFNRVVAGVHFPMDSHVGHQLGQCLAKAFVAMAMPTPARIGGAKKPIVVDATSQWVEGAQPNVVFGPAQPAPEVKLLQALWGAAEKELAQFKL